MNKNLVWVVRSLSDFIEKREVTKNVVEVKGQFCRKQAGMLFSGEVSVGVACGVIVPRSG